MQSLSIERLTRGGQRPWVQRLMAWGCVALLAGLAACASSGGGGTVANTLRVTPQASHALTFYEGEDDTPPEPFTPFLVANGPDASVISFGFSQLEGAYYLARYDAAWGERDISNGFQPSDPKWDCDQSPETSVLSPDATFVARPCADGSLNVFAASTAIVVFHRGGTPGGIALSARVPVAAFAPDSHTVALTNDGPSGPGQTITLYDTRTWVKGRTITLTVGLLSRPGWSADGTRLAAVALDGTLHIWDVATGGEVTTTSVPRFAIGGAASDPAGPAPLWSPDGAMLWATAPGGAGTLLTSWAVMGSTLVPHASATLAVPPSSANPQLAPDGQHLFVHTAALHGQIFSASDLRQMSDFALAGSLVLWTDASHLAVFTLQATVVPLKIG